MKITYSKKEDKMNSKKKLRGIVRIPEGALWISDYPLSSNTKGVKTHLAWPTLDNLGWLEDVLRFAKEQSSPGYVAYEVGKQKLHWKLASYTEDGWWFSHDNSRSSKTEFETTLFVPRELKFHPDYKTRRTRLLS